MSFAPVLADAGAAPTRTEQYYECWSNRAYYRDGWLARSLQKRGAPIDLDNWTLHRLDDDFSESIDLAASEPRRLEELVAAFDAAARENLVYPLDNRDRLDKFADRAPDEGRLDDVARRFLPGMQTVHRADVFPLIADRAFRISVRFEHRDGDAGVLWAIGDPTGGLLMWIEDGRLLVHYNGFGERTTLPGVPLRAGAGPGPRIAVLDYVAHGGRAGDGRLLLDGVEVVPFTPMAPTMVLYGVFEGLDVGLDRRGPVSWSLYERHGAYPYSGRVLDVTIEPGARAPR